MLEVMNYVESDAPERLTLVEWRRSRVAAPPSRRLRLRSLVPMLRRSAV
jgi:hypothetical protein